MTKKNNNFSKKLFGEIRSLIEQSRQQLALTVNSAITILYWQIGKRITDEILQNQRAAYRKELVQILAVQLTAEYGKGWGEKHLRHCLRIAETIKDENLPIGLILCASKNEEHIELLQLNQSNIKVADYLTELPDKKLLEKKLYLAIERAKNRLAS